MQEMTWCVETTLCVVQLVMRRPRRLTPRMVTPAGGPLLCVQPPHLLSARRLGECGGGRGLSGLLARGGLSAPAGRAVPSYGEAIWIGGRRAW